MKTKIGELLTDAIEKSVSSPLFVPRHSITFYPSDYEKIIDELMTDDDFSITDYGAYHYKNFSIFTSSVFADLKDRFKVNEYTFDLLTPEEKLIRDIIE